MLRNISIDHPKMLDSVELNDHSIKIEPPEDLTSTGGSHYNTMNILST